MTTAVAMPKRPVWTQLVPGGRTTAALRIVERNARAWRGLWILFLSMLVEPAFFLLSIGIGVGALVGDVTLESGTSVPYREFVAAGMLASSAMFGPVYDTTFGFFVKLKYGKLYASRSAVKQKVSSVTSLEIDQVKEY